MANRPFRRPQHFLFVGAAGRDSLAMRYHDRTFVHAPIACHANSNYVGLHTHTPTTYHQLCGMLVDHSSHQRFETLPATANCFISLFHAIFAHACLLPPTSFFRNARYQLQSMFKLADTLKTNANQVRIAKIENSPFRESVLNRNHAL